ncbi:MAG TPA: hypothetical protein VGC42_16940 [Kofleriaceae bacterium]
MMQQLSVATTLPVLVFDLDDPEPVQLAREAIAELRVSHPATIMSNVRATYRSPWHSHVLNPKLVPLCDRVVALARQASKAAFGVDLDHAPLVVSQCWVIVYEAGDGTRRHNHFPAVFGCAVYLDAGDGAAPMVVGGGTAIEPRPGRVVLFPGALDHAVPDHPGGARTVVSMNLRLEWPRAP